MVPSIKSVFFICASTGVGLSALTHTLASSNQCIALYHVPSELIAIFSPTTTQNLRISQETRKTSQPPPTFEGNYAHTSFSPHLIERNGAIRGPHIVLCGTKGMSKYGRHVPVLIVPVYAMLLRAQTKEKIAMEDLLVERRESYTIVQASHLANGERVRILELGLRDPIIGESLRLLGLQFRERMWESRLRQILC